MMTATTINSSIKLNPADLLPRLLLAVLFFEAFL